MVVCCLISSIGAENRRLREKCICYWNAAVHASPRWANERDPSARCSPLALYDGGSSSTKCSPMLIPNNYFEVVHINMNEWMAYHHKDVYMLGGPQPRVAPSPAGVPMMLRKNWNCEIVAMLDSRDRARAIR